MPASHLIAIYFILLINRSQRLTKTSAINLSKVELVICSLEECTYLALLLYWTIMYMWLLMYIAAEYCRATFLPKVTIERTESVLSVKLDLQLLRLVSLCLRCSSSFSSRLWASKLRIAVEFFCLRTEKSKWAQYSPE